MGNIISRSNFIYNENCFFYRNKKKYTPKTKTKTISNSVPMCVITPLSYDYVIADLNYKKNNQTTNINTTSLIVENNTLKV